MKLKIFILAVLIALPVFALAAGLVPCGLGKTGAMCTFCDFAILVNNVKDFILFRFALPAGVIVLMIAGVILLTAGGNTSKIEKGKSIFKTVVIGLFIAFAAWLMVDTIIRGLVSGTFFGSAPWSSFPTCESRTDYSVPVSPGDPSGSGGPTTRYKCLSETCVSDSNGPYTTANCDNKCVASTFNNRPSAQLQALMSCMVAQVSGLTITSITDDNIASGKCNPTDPNESFGAPICQTNPNDPNCHCQHGQYSCHYGGRNCASSGSYAIDIRSRDVSYTWQDVKTAATNCNAGPGVPKCYPEGDHYHVSIGSLYGCNCDTALQNCNI